MKKEKDDIELAKLLKENSCQASDNEWFTPCVLHRLPEKRRSVKWLKVIIYAMALAGVVVCWLWYSSKQDSSVVTVRDLLTYACMAGGSMAVASVAIIDFVKSE